jgi:acetolactate synthase regulatory subunit
MTKHILKIEFEAEEGALLRLLGTIQRRGFAVASITMPEFTGALKTVHLTLEPMQASYRIEVLQRQIARLHEVRAVTLVVPKPPRSVLGFLKGPIVGLQRKTLLAKETPACLPESSSHVS